MFRVRETGFDGRVSFRSKDVTKTEGDDLHTGTAVKCLGCDFVYDFGKAVSIFGQLWMIFVYWKIVRWEKLGRKAETIGRLA